MRPNTVCTKTEAAERIARKCDALKAMLLEKNERYNNSALGTVSPFVKASREALLLARAGDKILRINADVAGDDEDAPLDLAGYMVLLCIARDLDNGTP